MRTLRVLQLAGGLAIGDQVGGAELFAARLACGLAAHQIEAAVYGLWRYDSPREHAWLWRLQRASVRAGLLAAPSGRLPRDLARALAHLWLLVDAWQPQIINSHSERSDSLNMLIHLLHPLHPQAVRTMHTDEQWQASPRIGAVLGNVVFPLLFQREVAISAAVRQRLDGRRLARLLGKRAPLSYNGIDAALFARQPAARADGDLPAGIGPQRPRLVSIGRLSRQKGHGELLQAFASLRQQQPAALYLIGTGELEAELRQQCERLGIAAAVHFLGSRDDVYAILPICDMLVLASLWEGFPTVLLEAMALGVPVVATDVSGSRELVRSGETGLLVPPRRPQQLAQAMRTLLEQPQQAAAMAARARQHAQAFTMQRTVQQYARMYSQMMEHTQ